MPITRRGLESAIIRLAVNFDETEATAVHVRRLLDSERDWNRELVNEREVLMRENASLREDIAALTAIIHALCSNRAAGRTMARGLNQQVIHMVAMFKRLRTAALLVATGAGCRKKMQVALDKIEKGTTK